MPKKTKSPRNNVGVAKMQNFEQLATIIGQLHTSLRGAAAVSVIRMTMRNWMIGMYIVEYKQKGEDRAQYGSNLIPRLAQRLNDIRGFSGRNLEMFRKLYREYPQISQLVIAELSRLKINELQIPQMPSAELSPLKRAFYEIEGIKGCWSVAMSIPYGEKK
jgi:DUF1016 N-terminal domain